MAHLDRLEARLDAEKPRSPTSAGPSDGEKREAMEYPGGVGRCSWSAENVDRKDKSQKGVLPLGKRWETVNPRC